MFNGEIEKEQRLQKEELEKEERLSKQDLERKELAEKKDGHLRSEKLEEEKFCNKQLQLKKMKM